MEYENKSFLKKKFYEYPTDSCELKKTGLRMKYSPLKERKSVYHLVQATRRHAHKAITQIHEINGRKKSLRSKLWQPLSILTRKVTNC
jgi:hypothetical protein